MRHAETAELTGLVNQLNREYRSLCVGAKTVKGNLESLGEYIGLVHEELSYIGQIEDIELNRDWSAPGKLSAADLARHKKQVEVSLVNKETDYARIVALAERLVAARHPAWEDVSVSRLFFIVVVFNGGVCESKLESGQLYFCGEVKIK